MEVYPDEARKAAADPKPGPLQGVAVSVKDSFDIAGKATRTGSLLRRDAIAREDCTLVRRLKEAGAIVLGKTSTPEFLMNYETDNHYLGPTCNPWDLSLTPGGSSGGEAAAIAACCSAGGIGSDGGGSIREPAHFCGIAGLKPTPGRCPASGHWPEICHPGGFMGVAGPMARTAADVRLLFDVLAGHDPRDPFSVPFQPREEAMPKRFAVMEFDDVEAGCSAAVEDAEFLLSRLGLERVSFPHRLVDEAHDLWWFFFTVASAAPLREMIDGRRAETHWTGTELIDMVDRPAPSLAEYSANLLRRDRLRAELLLWLETCPLVLAPAFGTQAFPHRRRPLLPAVRTVSWVNLFGLPAMVVPVGFYEGLPAGVQLASAPYSDEMLLETAVRLEEARGDFPIPAI